MTNPIVKGWSLWDLPWYEDDLTSDGAEWRQGENIVSGEFVTPQGTTLKQWYLESRPEDKLIQDIGYVGSRTQTIFYGMLCVPMPCDNGSSNYDTSYNMENFGLLSVKDGDGNILYLNNEIDNLMRTEGLDGIFADVSDSAPAYYNLQGVQMLDEDNLPKGIYIKRTPTKSEKIVVR